MLNQFSRIILNLVKGAHLGVHNVLQLYAKLKVQSLWNKNKIQNANKAYPMCHDAKYLNKKKKSNQTPHYLVCNRE